MAEDLVSVWEFIGEDSDSPPSSRGSSSFSLPSDEIPADDFDEPCEPLGTSGGTAAFYALRYRPGREPSDLPRDFYIGKDVAHASDELDFYARLREAVKETEAWAAFGRRAMACPGVVRLACVSAKAKKGQGGQTQQTQGQGQSTQSRKLLLLLENLRQGFGQMRLLDVKLGAETSVACWKGKSRLNAWKNACVDQRTNSAVEGFRLEGMELPPRALEERVGQVLRAKSVSGPGSYISPKVIRRFTLQRLRASEFLEFWLDLSDLGPGAELRAHQVAFGAFRQMQELLEAVLGLEVPQQWIGSSVALATEVGNLTGEPRVAVKVFDWGRAELNTAADFASLLPEEKESRSRYWRQYLTSLARMYWELGRQVANRCCCPAWTVLVFELRTFAPVVLRAALLGESLSPTAMTTVAMGLFQMSPEGGKGEISLPLLGALDPLDLEPLRGSLRLRIAVPPQGVGLCSVQVCEAYDLDVNAFAGSIVTVRAVAFERPGDARMHLEAFQSGCPPPFARGLVCCRSTAPAKVAQAKLVWEDCLEFHGLGEAAAAVAQESVRASLASLGGAAAWPLPPPTGGSEEVEEMAKAFLAEVLPQMEGARG